MTGEMLTERFVSGKSLTKGSWTFVSRNYVKAAKGRQEWAAQIAEEVSAERHARLGTVGARPFAGAVKVDLTFFLPFGLRLPEVEVPIGHQTGDIDKLVRLVLDALKTGGVYTDDSVVVALHTAKLWAVLGVPPGVHIRAWAARVLDVSGRHAAAARCLEAQGLTGETGF